MKSVVIFYLHKFVTAFFAPFIYHFGDTWFFFDIASFAHDLVDIVALYFYSFLTVISIILFRNYILSILTHIIFRIQNFSNRLPLLGYFSLFFSNLINGIISIINRTLKKK